MDGSFEKVLETGQESHAESMRVLNRLNEVGSPEAVFSKPVKVGQTQVITASEVSVGLGFGFGSGSGPRIYSNLRDEENVSTDEETGMGYGGGGGGGAGARPVAVITITEDLVEVKPILDATKIALAFFTMLGSIFLLGAQMKKGRIS